MSIAKSIIKRGRQKDNTLPFGINYIATRNKYYVTITFTDTERPIMLSEWDTPEEAFVEYKMMKQADILLVIAKYKESIPDYIYDKFLTVEVKTY